MIFLEKTHKFLFTILFSQIFTALCFSQILNVDRITNSTDSAVSKSLNSVISLAININREDETIIDLKTSVEVSYKFKRNIIISLSQYELTSTENVNLINSGYSHLRFRINRESVIQPEFFMQYQWNGIRGMKSRFLAGANLRLLINKDTSSATYFALGLMNELERWDYRSVPENEIPFNTEDVHTNYIKLNCYLDTEWKIREDVNFSFIVYLQARPNANIIYPRISPSVKINFGVSEHLLLSFIMNSFYDSKPVVPIRNFYYNLSTGVSINF